VGEHHQRDVAAPAVPSSARNWSRPSSPVAVGSAAGSVVIERGAKRGVPAVDLVAGDASRGHPRRRSRGPASASPTTGLVANCTASGPRPRCSGPGPRPSALAVGRYSSRSMKVRRPQSRPKEPPIWQFSTRPAVPEYCRARPADLVPFLTTRSHPRPAPLRCPRGSTTKSRRSSLRRRERPRTGLRPVLRLVAQPDRGQFTALRRIAADGTDHNSRTRQLGPPQHRLAEPARHQPPQPREVVDSRQGGNIPEGAGCLTRHSCFTACVARGPPRAGVLTGWPRVKTPRPGRRPERPPRPGPWRQQQERRRPRRRGPTTPPHAARSRTDATSTEPSVSTLSHLLSQCLVPHRPGTGDERTTMLAALTARPGKESVTGLTIGSGSKANCVTAGWSRSWQGQPPRVDPARRGDDRTGVDQSSVGRLRVVAAGSLTFFTQGGGQGGPEVRVALISESECLRAGDYAAQWIGPVGCLNHPKV